MLIANTVVIFYYIILKYQQFVDLSLTDLVHSVEVVSSLLEVGHPVRLDFLA
jgi:hypothetical protein